MAIGITKEDRVQGRLAELAESAGRLGRSVRIMEVCGTHTVAVQRAGLRQLLPETIRLVSGPGCPICVTVTGYIDGLIDLAAQAKTIVAVYDDLLAVPGTSRSLADGGHVRVVGSASQAHALASKHPDRTVVFAAVGFEATAVGTAEVLIRAKNAGLKNFLVFCAHKRLMAAIEAISQSPESAADGFLCPGHISVMTGYRAYEQIVDRYRRPCVIAGFEPWQIVDAVARLVAQIADGRAKVENAYTAAVGPQRHERAWRMIDEVFEVNTVPWRPFGELPDSGLTMRATYRRFDAAAAFGLEPAGMGERPDCRCANVLRGAIDPPECPLFGRTCRLDTPVGTCMASSEGACRAWLAYSR